MPIWLYDRRISPEVTFFVEIDKRDCFRLYHDLVEDTYSQITIKFSSYQLLVKNPFTDLQMFFIIIHSIRQTIKRLK